MKIDEIVELSDKNPFPILARHAKLVEECGEFAESLLHHLGYLPHKTMKEPIEGEVADVIICLIDVLRAVYPNLSSKEFVEMIQDQLSIKSAKWKEILK